MVRQTRDEVLETLERHREEILALGVKRLGLFGSCARGESTGRSDLDFVVELEPKTFDAYMELKLLLEDLFGCRVDLVLQGAIKPRLRPRIMEDLVDVPGL
jgi:predicted nucleotidyltransferase